MTNEQRAYRKGLRDAEDKIRQLRRVAENGMVGVIEIGTDRGAATIEAFKIAGRAIRSMRALPSGCSSTKDSA